jgi:hypothetical protein
LSFIDIYADSATSINNEDDNNTIISIKHYTRSLLWGEKWNFVLEYSQFTSPSLGITFKYISSGEDALFGFTGRKEAYRLNNIICIWIKPIQNMQPDEKIWCIEIFANKPQKTNYIKRLWTNTRDIFWFYDDQNSKEDQIISSKIHKVIGKKIWYLSYHKDDTTIDQSWIKNIKAIKDNIKKDEILISKRNNPLIIPSCAQYINIMKCVANKSGGWNEALIAVNQAVDTWSTLSLDQLYQTCTIAVEAIRQNKKAYDQLGCYL